MGITQKSRGSYFWIRFITLFVLMGILSSCEYAVTSGLYHGKLFEKFQDRSINESIRAQVSSPKKNSGVIEVEDLSGRNLEVVKVSWRKAPKKIKIQIAGLSSEVFELMSVENQQKGEDWHCFQASATYSISFCSGLRQVLIQAYDPSLRTLVFSLTADFAPEQKPVEFEAPRDFTLPEAIQRVMTQGFEARIDFEKVVQARESVRIAYFNLLPHFSYRDLLAISTLTPNVIANWVADFVPFVIPTRWMKVSEAKDRRWAEETSLDILRSDLAYQVSSLTYVYDRDQESLRFYREQYELLQEAHQKILRLGGSEVGKIGTSLDELELRASVVKNLSQQEILRSQNAVHLDRAALSLSLGFVNPEAMRAIHSGEELNSIEKAPQLLSNPLIPIAIERSLELKQLDYLISEASTQKDEYYFNWLDPDVPANQAISLSLYPYISKAEAMIREMVVKRERTQSQIAQKVVNTVGNYNSALWAYQIIKPEMDKLLEREVLLFQDIRDAQSKEDLKTTAGNLQWLMNSIFQFQAKLNESIAVYRISRAQVQRLLFEGYYSREFPRANHLPNSPEPWETP